MRSRRTLWKALIVLTGEIDTAEKRAAVTRRVIDELLADHESRPGPPSATA
ncbi:hypothetical protein ACSDR0_30920 [Streptosporangium sp. G11]|uniref:hypothetical protein n=1 Tax=Streptosporangium sp. G11 TaxID=3436926 RepID=UPI003EB770BA